MNRIPEKPEAEALLRWYDQNRRILPWREDPSPYHVWISEIMLQQTRVETVIGYYERFLEAFPDIPALAEAEEERLMKLWQGLGYYSRARNLHRTAKLLAEAYGGRLPGDLKSLTALPGIGEYTASAIASIAFGLPVPAIDGNLLRIFARMTGYEKPIKTPEARKAANLFFRGIFPEDRPGDMNQALMDLGAGVCLPNGAPDCPHCPWQIPCRACREKRTADIPVRDPKRARKQEALTVFLILTADELPEVLIRQRPASGLLAGLYEFPNVPGHLGEREAAEALASLGIPVRSIEALPECRHIFTHREWHMKNYLIGTEPKALLSPPDQPDRPGRLPEQSDRPGRLPEQPKVPAGPGALFPVTPDTLRERYSVPTAFRSCLRVLDPSGRAPAR